MQWTDRNMNTAYNSLSLLFSSVPKERILPALSVLTNQPVGELEAAIVRDNRGFKLGDKVAYFSGGGADKLGTIMKRADTADFMFYVKLEGSREWSQLEKNQMRLVTRFEDLDFGDFVSTERLHVDLH